MQKMIWKSKTQDHGMNSRVIIFIAMYFSAVYLKKFSLGSQTPELIAIAHGNTTVRHE